MDSPCRKAIIFSGRIYTEAGRAILCRQAKVSFSELSSCLPPGSLFLSAMRQLATITVIGRDKTGVIARVTNFLFEQSANIEALEEQVTRGQFSMTLQASWKTAE